MRVFALFLAGPQLVQTQYLLREVFGYFLIVQVVNVAQNVAKKSVITAMLTYYAVGI